MLVITGGAGFIGSALLWQLDSLGRDDIVAVIEYVVMPPGLARNYQNHTEASTASLAAAGYTQPFLSLEEGARLCVRLPHGG